jgi:hypothetical protein
MPEEMAARAHLRQHREHKMPVPVRQATQAALNRLAQAQALA